MAKFIIQPHGRLQEWIADEKGFFREEGLDYEFQRGPSSDTKKLVDAAGKVSDLKAGAFESYEKGGGNKGVKSDISCACHWTVNQAASEKIGKMWGKSYVFTPGGIMVPPESSITAPEQLADQEVAVGYHSGSHYTTIQALEPYMPRDRIKLRFGGSIWARVDIGVGRDLPAVSVWGLSFQVLEQLGFRKVVDASFMIAFMFPPTVDTSDVEKYMNGMKRAQMALDFAPEKYRHYYRNESRSGIATKSMCGGFRPVSASYFCPTPKRRTRRPKPGFTSEVSSKASHRSRITPHRSPPRVAAII